MKKIPKKLKIDIGGDFVEHLTDAISRSLVKTFHKLNKKYGTKVTLQFIDDELVDAIKKHFGVLMDLEVQQLHEWFGE